ncbi:hypothetical protein [Rhizobium paknamense]|uniref:N-acetylglucosamine-6-phosphate deacetylase n=1 Tax=Rhizobium paknamense TaxID=1206817 RepID=A0ABU0IGK8_9HYPH|nr:hypothetical protein [Rhizobium paknamense]MDQ0456381.1 N-acetylglucosamine-6-phosphate deacetylase [Rhizobium paknamense]
MSVEQVSGVSGSTLVSTPSGGGDDKSASGSTTKKYDPNTEETILEEGIASFLPSAMSNLMQLNNSIFNYAKDAIDEASDE